MTFCQTIKYPKKQNTHTHKIQVTSKGLGRKLELVSTGQIQDNLTTLKNIKLKHINYIYNEKRKNILNFSDDLQGILLGIHCFENKGNVSSI